jgi:hypothetical protein
MNKEEPSDNQQKFKAACMTVRSLHWVIIRLEALGVSELAVKKLKVAKLVYETALSRFPTNQTWRQDYEQEADKKHIPPPTPNEKFSDQRWASNWSNDQKRTSQMLVVLIQVLNDDAKVLSIIFPTSRLGSRMIAQGINDIRQWLDNLRQLEKAMPRDVF